MLYHFISFEKQQNQAFFASIACHKYNQAEIHYTTGTYIDMNKSLIGK
jgi:hypothetical protein